MKVINTILNSFALRNLALFTLMYGAAIVRAIATSKSVSDIVDLATVWVSFYLVVMFHNVVLYKRYLARRKYFIYFIGLLITELTFHLVLIAEEKFIQKQSYPSHTLAEWFAFIWTDLVYVGLGFAAYYSFNHYKEKHKALQLQYINRDLELKQLKEQLNPHFLFNALNNIYSYSLEKNAYSKELILKLSELMEFILTNSAKEKIPLKEELAFIDNYITFEKERLGDSCDIVFTKDIRDENIEVAPFILFTLIENAFKHGTNTTDRSHINIDISSGNNTICLTIQNPITEIAPAKTTRVGLPNLSRRLELLYGGKHLFRTEVARDTFNSHLSLTV